MPKLFGILSDVDCTPYTAMPQDKPVSHTWYQQLSAIKLALLDKAAHEADAVKRGTDLLWLNELTPYDVKFLKTLRIEP